MKTKLIAVLLSLASFAAFAGPPPGGGPKWAEKGEKGEDREERMEARGDRMRLMMVVAISEALDLTDAEALKIADKLKAIEEKRRPLRQSMGEAMKSLRDASEGDQAALGQVDANVAKVLEGRAQMAAMDKELFAQLSQGFPPQKRAKLALVLAKVGHEFKGGKKGRR